ncbi:MAG: TRAP transporter large permease [Gemmatimonadetes bacterium]|nr:TRAP transporter large permease [Gemmatimonadota bacterium]
MGPLIALVVLVLFLLGLPLFAVLGAATALALRFLAALPAAVPHAAEYELARNMFRVLDQDALLAIPMFVLAGVIMSGGGISRRLVDVARSATGWAPGGLAIAAVAACVVFAAISGSSPATVVAIGIVMYPALIRAGYRAEFGQGLLSSAGSLGILIPPSIPMIVYAIMVPAASVSAMFIAGVLPGLLIAAIFALYCLRVGIVARVPRVALNVAAVAVALRRGVWSLLLPVIILGGIYTGLLTVNEAAAAGVVYALLVETRIHRELRLRDLPRLISQSAAEMGVILAIVMVAAAFSQYLTLAGVPDALTAWLRATLPTPQPGATPWAYLLLVNVILIVAGALIDSISAILILAPILAAAGAAFGVDPIHLGIIMIVNLEIGYLTPPFGINLFVASTIFEQPLIRVLRGVVPFVLLMLIALLAVTFVPALSLTLGRLVQ